MRLGMVAVVVALVALPVARARADMTALTPTVVARVPAPEFVAAATAASTPSDGVISSSLAVSPITGLLVGDQGHVTLTPRSPGVFAGARTDIWVRPATYYWQAYDSHCNPPSPPACHSAPVAFQVTPLPAPVMVSPADGAQIPAGTFFSWTIGDVPSYLGARQVGIQRSLSPQLAPSGLFAQPLGQGPQGPAAIWLLQSSIGADGIGTSPYRLDDWPALFHKRIYWLVWRRDCGADPDCYVTDGQVRSVIVGPISVQRGVAPDDRLAFRLVSPMPIGWQWVRRPTRHKQTLGDVYVNMTCRGLPCRVALQVTIRLGGRTRVLARRTLDRPADPAMYWAAWNHIEHLRLSKRLRASILAALRRHSRVPITAVATTTNLAGRPERHVGRGHFVLSQPRR
jgi:hypothetical protein